ncbi:MAG: Lrp/AsnC family transcriptional regulator [Pseudomonadales bacterium]
MMLDDKDKELLNLLSTNCRESIAALARKLKLSRSTVKDRIERLERRDVIKGYTLRLSDDFTAKQIQVQVMITSEPKLNAQIARDLRQMQTVKALYAVNGIYDMIAMLSTDSTKSLDQTLDRIGAMEGVVKTVSSIILSTKFER